MAIDLRATVTCSLGTLISGNVGDDYLQGSGLVKTSGSCEISGLITPAVGTIVTFSYTKGGVVRSIPRKLRVLSSFADPFRRTTKVELGCKLTYLSDLREPISWDAFDDPENAGYNADDQRIVTLPISAASAMSKCLFELGITASSIPLTNFFSIPRFDFSAGYVDVLSDLLVSESYFGYLDTDEVLQVVPLDQEAGTGPVYTGADIVDLGPIGTGPLPGEAVTVSYSTLKLKNPEDDDDDDETEKLNWELQETIGALSFIFIDWTLGEDPTPRRSKYQYIPRTEVRTEYDEWDRMIRRITKTYTIGAALNTTYYKDIAEGGRQDFGYGWAISAQEIIEVEIPQYAELYDGRKEKPENYDEVTSSTTEKTEPRMAVLGGAGISTKFFVSEDGSSFSVGFESGRSTTEIIKSIYTTGVKDVMTASGIGTVPVTRSSTNKKLAYAYTQQGQQDFAERAEKGNPLNFGDAFILIDNGTETIINTGRELALQSRPSAADRTNAALSDGGDPNNGWRTESKAQLELALGSAAAQRRIEFSMPYASDDRFVGLSGGPFLAIRSNAPQKANRYGRVQNRLLLGNRSGVNLQLAPERLPAAPFTPLYLQADGLTALYRANGNQWAFDSNGIVCSTDALFWAAVGGTGTFWFPVAPGITTLPAEPAIVDGEMNATNVVLPYNETAIYESRLRLGNVVTKFDYALELLTEPDPLVVRTTLQVRSISVIVLVPDTTIALSMEVPDFALPLPTPQSSIVNSFTYTGTGTTQTIETPFVDPSLVFIKNYLEDFDADVYVFDRVRGATKYWVANDIEAEVTDAQTLTAFNNASFTVGTSSLINANTKSYMVWAFGGTGETTVNTAGTLTANVATSDVFSIIEYTGNSTAGATFGHGLAGTPDAVLVRRRTPDSPSLLVYGVVGGPSLGTNINVEFGSTDPAEDNSALIRSANTTTVTLGSNVRVNLTSSVYSAYAFRSVAGKSKVGTYVGDGVAGGQYIECDFTVDFVIVKALDNFGGYWFIFNRDFAADGDIWTTISEFESYQESNIMYSLENTGFRVFVGSSVAGLYDNLNEDTETYFYMAFAAVLPSVYVDLTTDTSIEPQVPTISAN
jgi:hypothetical protein